MKRAIGWLLCWVLAAGSLPAQEVVVGRRRASGGGGTAPTVVQSAVNSTGASGSVGLTINVTSTASGNGLVVGLCRNDANTAVTSVVLQNAGSSTIGTLAEDANTVISGVSFTNSRLSIYKLANIAASGTKIVVTGFFTGVVVVYEITGANTTDFTDTVSKNANAYNASPWNSGTTGSLSSTSVLPIGFACELRTASQTFTHTGWTSQQTGNPTAATPTLNGATKDTVSSTAAVSMSGTVGTTGNSEVIGNSIVVKP